MSETFQQVCTGLIFQARDECNRNGTRITREIVDRIITEQMKAFGLSPAKAVLVNGKVHEIYLAYPKHKAPKDAYRAIEKALREVTAEELLKKTQTYAYHVSTWPKNYRYTKEGRDIVPHPASWFNSGSYNDDQSEWVNGGKKETEAVNYSRF